MAAKPHYYLYQVLLFNCTKGCSSLTLTFSQTKRQSPVRWFPQRWRTPARRWPAAMEAPASSRRTACRQSACAPSGAWAKLSRRCAAAMERTTATSVNSTSTPARARRTYECSTRAAVVSFSLMLWQWTVSLISTAIDNISTCLIGVMDRLNLLFSPSHVQFLCPFRTFLCFSFHTFLLILILPPLCFASHEHCCQLFPLSRSSKLLFSSGTDFLPIPAIIRRYLFTLKALNFEGFFFFFFLTERKKKKRNKPRLLLFTAWWRYGMVEWWYCI